MQRSRYRAFVLPVRMRYRRLVQILGLAIGLLAWNLPLGASTYVVEIPLDSAIYNELDTLNGLGLLDTYFPEIRPISRIEAARLTLEAQDNIAQLAHPPALAKAMLSDLGVELKVEIGWVRDDNEDDLPNVIQPMEREELQYVFSSGARRAFNNGGLGPIDAAEATPLLPNNDNLPTQAGSNEAARWAGWAGVGTFLTGYGEGAVAGPLTRAGDNGRVQLLTGAAVVSLGNFALSFGQEEMAWGEGFFGSLSQGANAQPFPALRLRNVHPSYLPGLLRYLGPLRLDIFFGQLDADRVFAHPWIDGEAIVFKPLPQFEFGFDHAIMFGGRYNDHYGTGGFFGRATGFDTGDPAVGNTNSRAGLFFRIYVPSLRNLQLYQETLGEDNLTNEVPGIGRFLPFLSVSYQGGIYLPELTADGRTTLRIEYALLHPTYSNHSDSLYWTYYNRLMGYPLGPDATRIDVAVGRWLDLRDQLLVDGFGAQRRSGADQPGQNTEQSAGIALDLWRMPARLTAGAPVLGEMHLRASLEYVRDLNFTNASGLRTMLMISFAFSNPLPRWSWE